MVTASGPQASEALEALRALADEGFGDGIAPDGAPPPPVPVAQPPAATVQAPGAGDVLSGVPASAGVAIGPARRLGAPPGPPPDRAADSPERERERLDEAIAAARGQIARDREAVAGRAGKAEAAIFDAHLALLDDEALLEPAHEAIAAGAAAERAWHDAAEQVAALYRGLDEPLLRERATDVLDVGRRVVAAVTGEEAAGPTEPGIVLARELTPAEAAGLDPDAGARDRHRPRLGHRARGDPRPRARPARRGRTGRRAARHRGGHRRCCSTARPGRSRSTPERTCSARPGSAASASPPAARPRASAPTSWARCATARAWRSSPTSAPPRRRRPRSSSAPRASACCAPSSSSSTARSCPTRTSRSRPCARSPWPSTAGRSSCARSTPAPTSRCPALPMPPEANPFLGVRGIRLTLERPEILATQLRAILRVAAEHPVKAMLPMVATLAEVRATRALLDEARTATGIDAPLELGIMVEIPAAALTAEHLAEHVDFFSVGTNDLTQYTMAAERGDERLAGLLAGPQPAVLRLIKATVDAAAARGRWVGVCGELAGDPAAAVLLAGLGVTELSMAPALVAEAKAALRAVDLADARAAADAALDAEDADEARRLAAALL